MYAADFSAYFFCEVKGPADQLRQVQASKFQALTAIDGVPVCLLKFKWTYLRGKGNRRLPAVRGYSTLKDIRQALAMTPCGGRS
jgi:hypothetical protein